MRKFRIAQFEPQPGVIDLGVGQPSTAILPLEIMRKAAARLDQANPAILQYGAEYGDDYFRQTLARFLSDAYHLPVNDEHLLITNGNSQALDMICTVLTEPGDVIFVEEPTYFLALDIFADHGLRVISIPVDEQGLQIDALEDELRQHRPKLLYVIPAYQNPTGFTLSHTRRQRLVELSQQHGFLIVADEVYQLLDYAVEPPPAMASYIDGETVLSLGTFSKILAPGLRLGWVQAAPLLLEKLAGVGVVDSGGGLNPFTSALVRIVLEAGWQHDYLEFLRRTYRRRIKVMSRALHHRLPGWVSFNEPQGGYFFWLSLPVRFNATELQRSAQQQRVDFRPGSKFSSRNALGNCLRLSFAYYGEEEIEEGIGRLARVFA